MTCNAEGVSRRRREIKAKLVAEAGGRCARCGYDRSMRALHFHHLDPAEKGRLVSNWTRSEAGARAEAEKCILLCANCHAEEEDQLALVAQSG